MVSNPHGFPLDEVRDVLFRTDVSGRWTYLNRAWTEVTGFPVEESLGQPFLDYIHPDDRERILHLFRPLLARQTDHCFHEIRYLTRDGGSRWIEVNSRLALAPDGAATGTIGTLRDVTARRGAEADRAFLATLVGRMQEAVIVTDLEWRVQRWTGNAEGIYGWTADEAIGRPLFGLLCPESERASMEEIARKLRGGLARMVGERTRKDGRRIITDASLGLLLGEGGRPCGVLGVSRDVSAQTLAEQGLRESEERYRSVVAAMAEGMILHGAGGRVVACNSAAERILGLRAEELLGRSSLHFPRPALRDDGSSLADSDHPAVVTLRTGEPVCDVVMGIPRPDGALAWIAVNSQPIGQSPGTPPSAVVSTFTDVTALRARTEELRREHRRLELALEASSDGIWEWDFASGALAVSPRCTQILGEAPGALQLTGEGLRRRLAPEDLPGALAAVAAHLEGRTPLIDLECRAKTRDGSWRWVGVRGKVLDRDSAGRPLRAAGTFSDADARHREHERLLREARLEALERRINEMELVAAKDGSILEANDRALAAYGYDKEEMRRLNLRDLRDERGLSTQADDLRRALEGDGVRVETWGRRRDGSAFPIEVSARKVQVGDETLLHCLVRDLTEQRAAERALKESEARFRTLVDGAPVGVFETDAQGRCTFVNRVGQQMTGLTFEEAKGTGWLRAVSPESREAAALWEAATGAGETVSRACRTLGADGGPIWVQIWAAPQRDTSGQIVGYVGVVVDVTDRQRAEEALRESNHRKTEFFAVLSHELRNPLAPMRNAAFLLDRAPPGSAQAERAKAVLQRQTAHLAQLVDDMLDVNRIARGTIALERAPVDVRALLRATCEDYAPLFERRGVELRIEAPGEPIWIDADATRVRQIIGNLLHNAAKFAPTGGFAATNLTASLDRARLIVTDSGPGVDSKLLGKLFEPLAPVRQSSAQARAGLGLGLALVKGLVEAHGGEVSVQTDAQGWGKGFEVSLPLSAPPSGPPRAAPDAAPARPAKRVLIIEDDPDAGQTLAEVLGTDGHAVHVAVDGRTGIALAHELEPDVVVCDIGLPDLDGFEVARALRADPALAGARLIAFSGHAMAEDLERSRSAGFDAHLRKPASVENLLKVVAG